MSVSSKDLGFCFCVRTVSSHHPDCPASSSSFMLEVCVNFKKKGDYEDVPLPLIIV